MNIDLAGIRVMLAMPCGPQVPWQTMMSLTDTCLELHRRGIQFRIKIVSGCSLVDRARTKIVHEFLKTDADRLFMLDSDMVWTPADALRLLALSTQMKMVGALYPMKSDPPTFQFNWDEERLHPNEFGCLPILGMGLGFAIVQRSVIEALAKQAPKLVYPAESEREARVFRCTDDGNEYSGEDMAFCADVRALGHEVWVDPEITLGHVGTKVYCAPFRNAQRPA